MTQKPNKLRRILSLAAWYVGSVASAYAYDEIQVYNNAINDPGQFGLEMHSNFVVDGRRTPSYKGELPPNHTLAFTPEFSYGLTKFVELGLYLPFSVDVDRNLSFMDNAKIRTKFLNAQNPNFYYGLNIEVSVDPRRYSQTRWGSELRPIIGGNIGDWSIAFNPNLELSLSGSSLKPAFGPQIKVMRNLNSMVAVGVEHYSDLGTPDRIVASRQQTHTTYLVTDWTLGNIDLNVGVGRGWTNVSDDWTVKIIVGGIPFMDLFQRALQ